VTKALIVEDSAPASKAIEKILTSSHLECDVAPTGREAIIDIEKFEYDLAFVDIGLPDMNGLTLILKIRSHYINKKHIPIIALTMHDTDEYKKAAIEYGADEFGTKPLTAEKFRSLLKKYCNYN